MGGFFMNLRRIIFAAAVVACMGVAANADVYPNAIGLRFGGGSLWGAEINYQMGMGEANRLEFGLGLRSWGSDGYNWDYNGRRYWIETRHTSLGVYGAYQWYWNISPSAARGGFNWYVGPGAGVGFWSTTIKYPAPYNSPNYNDSGLDIGVGGQIGIEYDFNVLGAPLVLDIDSRPTIVSISTTGGLGIGVGIDLALGFRYTF
jgi:opacity protein-like surface antigen